MEHAQLRGTSLKGAYLDRANLASVIARGADLSDCKLDGVRCAPSEVEFQIEPPAPANPPPARELSKEVEADREPLLELRTS